MESDHSLSSLLQGSSMDLREYSEKILSDLHKLEDESIQDYLRSQTEISSLYNLITTSNSTLSRMETLLSRFQDDLGCISSEIRNLQEQSLNMTVSLQNRKNLEKRLDAYLKQVTIPPKMIEAICNAEINEKYLELIQDLRTKVKYFKEHSRLMTSQGTLITALSMQEVAPELNKLTSKGCSRARNFLLSHIHSLNKPKTNVNLYQETILVKYKELLMFIRENSQETFVEICMNYTETLSGIYLKHFKVYMSSLKRLILDTYTKNDLIVLDEALAKSSVATNRGPQIFDITERATLLAELEERALIVYHTAHKKGEKFVIERIFQSVSRLLTDNVSFTFIFVLEFFSINAEQYDPVFKDIFEKTFAYILETLGTVVNTTWDILGILLIIKVNETFQGIMEKRGIMTMNGFFEKVYMILWPRFQTLLDLNIKSMTSARRINVTDICPHAVTYRFSRLAISLHKVTPTHSSEMYLQRVNALKSQMLDLLQRMSQEFNDEKNRTVFLINNIDLIFQEYSRDQVHTDLSIFEEASHTLREQFIDLQLTEIFGDLVALGHKMKGETIPPEAEVERFVNDFAQNWKKGINLIKVIEKDLFSEDLTRSEILKATLMRLTMTFNDVSDGIKKFFPQIRKGLVPVHNIMNEINTVLSTPI